jgi:hypothetical protein
MPEPRHTVPDPDPDPHPPHTESETEPPPHTEPEPEPEQPTDPFDVDRLRQLAPSVGLTEQMLLSVAVRKPIRTEFFRVHPHPAYSIDWWAYVHKTDGGEETYWVTNEMRDALDTDVRPVRIFTCITKANVVFLWPARLPFADSNFGRRWHDTALAAADRAKTTWVRLVSNKSAGAYEIVVAKGDLGEPQWPKPSLGELLKLGFGDGRTIDHPDHPVLRQLRGDD